LCMAAIQRDPHAFNFVHPSLYSTLFRSHLYILNNLVEVTDITYGNFHVTSEGVVAIREEVHECMICLEDAMPCRYVDGCCKQTVCHECFHQLDKCPICKNPLVELIG
jgi:hypothetical protein